MRFSSSLLFTLCVTVALHHSSAHLTYTSRDYGVFTSGVGKSMTLQSTASNFGWADGTDTDFASQDRTRYFRFTIANPTTITIALTALDPTLLLPAFSIYRGLGHLDTADPDYDGSSITMSYLASLGAPTREGAFDALHTWKIGNNAGTSFSDLSTLVYVDHAADGTPANYGSVAGIKGDGLADGFVTGTFLLTAGDYTLAVGGADFFNQTVTTGRTFNATMSTVPEPTSGALAAIGLLLCAQRRSRDARN